MVVNGVTKIELPGCEKDLEQDSSFGQGATLPCFVAGPENRLVTVAIERLLVGEDLASTAQLFNPLVLVGPTASGKSHLAQGIVRHWYALLGEDRVDYFTATDFARQLHAARTDGLLAGFRQRLSTLSLMVIENLPRLPQRAFVQRELREVIDSVVDAGGVVVVTTQQPPATMPELDDGLRDRLASGFTVGLRPPGMDARMEILHLLAKNRGAQYDVEQLRRIAQHVDGPVPQLLRALAETDLEQTTGQNIASAREPLKLKHIVAVVARYYSLTQAALRSSARRKSLVHARGIVIHLARRLTDLSYSQIGQGLGRRDHTTIMHGERSVERLLASDAETQRAVEELQRILTAH